MSEIENSALFDLFVPETPAAPFVLNSPHSGRDYSSEFLKASRLTAHAIRSSEDFHMDTLIAGGADLGLTSMSAKFPRAFLDINREPFELDPDMFDEPLPSFANTASARVLSGLGTVAKIVAEGQPIYKDKLQVQEILDRVDTYYEPYHSALRKVLTQTQKQFGFAVLLDCHSMPSSSTGMTLGFRPDLVLGDRFGKSCSAHLLYTARSIFEAMGYRVVVNKPYAGGFITEHYGRPDLGLHALQIEINRGIYMKEASLKKSPDFENVQADITSFFRKLIDSDWHLINQTSRQAAE